MGVFKEEAYTFETIEKIQSQIYNDAADIGVIYDKNNVPNNIKAVFDSIKYLKSLDKKFPKEISLIRKRETWKNGVEVTVRIAWEIDAGMDYGTEYTISYNVINPNHPSLIKKGNAMITVESRRYKELTK
jgi:hypothetical protein